MKANSKLISSVVILTALFLFTAFSIAKRGKPVAKIKLEGVHVVYFGVKNPVLISVPGYGGNELRIYCEGCYMFKESTLDGYSIEPTNHKMVTISVKVKSGNKFETIATDSFRVKDIPNPVFYFGKNSRDCTMSHDEIRKELGVFSRMVNCDFSGSFKITSFSMSLYTNEKWNESTTEGPAFTEAQKKDLAALQPGDRIIFHHINVKGNHGFDSTITRTIPGMFVTVQ
jgi:hypothetical protein